MLQVLQDINQLIAYQAMVPLGISNGKYKLDPAVLAVRYEMMFTGSV